MKFKIAASIFVLSCAATAAAQEARTTTVTRATTNAKVAAEIIASSSTKTVKGAPFTAEAVSESVQTLADGNKITHSVTHKLYRDSEGRFRREETSNSGANSLAILGSNQAISIFDPVAGVRYSLNPTTKNAYRTKNLEGTFIISGSATSELRRVTVEPPAAAPRVVAVLPRSATTTSINGKTESLGMRDFEGVQAEGTRTVTTIAAGAIGNEQPIEIVYERWHSKDLDMIVYSKHSDPRFGEQTYRLTSINRSEPDRSLFTLPADYKLALEEATFTTRKQ